MKSEKGFTLIEVLIALALLGIIAATFLMAIATASKSILIADERTIAESLARWQMESVKEQGYIYDDDENDPIYGKIDTSEYPSFNISSDDENPEEYVVGIPWDSALDMAVFPDIGLQKITLFVWNNDKIVLTLEGYKVDEGVY